MSFSVSSWTEKKKLYVDRSENVLLLMVKSVFRFEYAKKLK